MVSNSSATIGSQVGMPHWIHLAATYWTRTQLTLASVILTSLVTISLGLAPTPKSILVVDLISRYPGPAVGLGGALLILSVLAFVIAGRPERLDTSLAINRAQSVVPQAAIGNPTSQVPTPPYRETPAMPSASAAPAVSTSSAKPAPTPDLTLNARGRRWRTIAVGVLILASLALAGVGTAQAIKSSNDFAKAPVSAVSTYCANLMRQDYAQAYELVSARVQIAEGNVEFTHYSRLRDVVDGKVQSCRTTGAAQITSSSAQVPVVLTRVLDDGQSHNYHVTAHAVLEQNGWRMDFEAPPQLGVVSIPLSVGSDIAPLAIADDWCQAIVARNLGLAYGALSATYINTTYPTLDSFITDIAQISSGPNPVELVSCVAPPADYQAPANLAALLPIHFVLTLASPSSADSTPTQADADVSIEMVTQGSTWAVNKFTLCETYTSGGSCNS